MAEMSARDAGIWLHRRAGFGLPSDRQRLVTDRGVDSELSSMLATLEPTEALATSIDPWDNDLLPFDPRDRESRSYAIDSWLNHLVVTDQPLVDRLAWLWHGHFVSSLEKVKVARYMVDQVRLFRAKGFGSFVELLRAVTIDPAMMDYLDLRTSTGSDPNENYAREMMELFTLGAGGYVEADVQRVAVALSGWRLNRQGQVRFVANSHDDKPQSVLGVDGVHDLDSVIDAVSQQPAMAVWIAGLFAVELLGTAEPEVVNQLASEFVAANFAIDALVAATLRLGLSGVSAPIVLAPVPWITVAQRVCAVDLPRKDRLFGLRGAGQLPLVPPNVGGWPGGPAWFSASSLVARVNLASSIAQRVDPNSALLAVAGSGDIDGLAELLGVYDVGFSVASTDAILGAESPPDRLALALASPEFMIV